MRLSVVQLQEFYASPMGRTALRMVNRRLSSLWAEDVTGAVDDLEILGFGYTGPYLDGYRDKARRLVLAMPGGQGAMVTQSARGNIACLTEEASLPFPPASFDRILISHGLEDCPDIPALMAELWRIMKPEGRLVIITANRSGLWAQSDSSPFGHGRPFSRGQLSRLLKEARFTPQAWAGAAYVPPLKFMMKPRSSLVFERFGETVYPRFSGLVLVQALKRLYADINPAEAEHARTPKFVKAAGVEPSTRTYGADLRSDITSRPTPQNKTEL